MSDIDSNVADMNRLLKVYETFDAESQTAKVLNAEIDRLADAIDAEAERALWMPVPLEADWLDQVDPRDPQSRTHRETATARIAAKSVSEEVEALALIQHEELCTHRKFMGWTQYKPWDKMPDDTKLERYVGVRAVLAHLQSTGRLIPPGGMALTAEQVLDLKNVLDHGHPMSGQRLLDALFPATEPAEVTGQDFRDAMPTEPDCWDVCEGHPASAEPAKEETKAEYPRTDGDFTVLGPEIFTDASGDFICWKGVNYVRQPDPASSPVVPAPTESEWQTWGAVPRGQTVRAANGERFRKNSVGAVHILTNGVGDCCQIDTVATPLPAPFTAVEETS